MVTTPAIPPLGNIDAQPHAREDTNMHRTIAMIEAAKAAAEILISVENLKP